MEIDWERRRQILAQIRAACEQFHTKHKLLSVNDGVIEQFLEETAHIELDSSNKLICFASFCSQRFGWDGSSKVHRFIIDTEGGGYSFWINEGLALMTDESLEFDYRKHIAEDVEKLITEARDSEFKYLKDIAEDNEKLITQAGDGADESVACFWAQYYTKHPLRDDTDPKWLQQAIKWCEISVAELRSRSTNELGPHELCQLADLYRQSDRLDDAARLYTLALGCDLPECCENARATSIKERLAMCRSSS